MCMALQPTVPGIYWLSPQNFAAGTVQLLVLGIWSILPNILYGKVKSHRLYSVEAVQTTAQA